jgi:hypothetical protein
MDETLQSALAAVLLNVNGDTVNRFVDEVADAAEGAGLDRAQRATLIAFLTFLGQFAPPEP